MGFLDDTDAPSQLPGFGSRESASAQDVMRVQRDGKALIFGGEVTAEYLDQEHAESWINERTNRTETTRFLRRAVRVKSANQFIKVGDQLVVAGYPLSRRWVNVEKFKGGNKKGANERSRASRTDVSEMKFHSETEMLNWIERLPLDYWEKGDYVTAAILRPDVSPKARYAVKGIKTFGVCGEPAKQIVEELLQSNEAGRLVDQARDGTLYFQAPGAVRAGADYVALSQELRDGATGWLSEAILRALAGPDNDQRTRFIGRPVMELAAQIFRNLLNEENRRLNSPRSRESELE